MVKPDKYINKYGTELSYNLYGRTYSVKGIMQPYRYNRRSFYNPERTPSGVFDAREYLFITKSDYYPAFYRGLKLSRGEDTYIVKSYEPYTVSGEILYIRVILTVRIDSWEV